MAPGSPPDNPVRGLVPCFIPPRMLQSGASFCRFLSVVSDAPVRGPGFPPGRWSPGAWAVLHSAPDAPIRGVFLSYYLRCLGRSSPWPRVLPRTIQSGGLGRAPLRPGCSNPGRLFVVFSPLPWTLQSVAPGSPPDDQVRKLVPCFIPPRMLQSGASCYRILSVASDAPVRGTWFTPGQSSPGACAMLHSAPDAPIRGVFLSCSLRCLGCSSPWHRILPQTIRSGGLGRAPLRPGCSTPPRMLHSAPDAPIRGVFLSYSLRCFGRSSPWHRVHPRTIQSGGLGRAPLRPGCSNPWRQVSYSLCCLRVTNPTARSQASWLCALWGRHEGVRGGRLLPGCVASRIGRSRTPDHSSFRACGRGPLSAGRGCGVRAWGPGCPWHLVPCRGSSCVVRASRVRGTRWPLWLGTCPCAVAVAGGVPLWRALWPRVGAPLLLRSGRYRCSGRLSRRRGAFPHPGGCRPRLYLVAARGTWRLAEYRAHCACRWPLPRQGRWVRSASYPFGAPRWGCPWRVPPASVLGCVRCGGSACVHPVTDAFVFTYRPSFNGGLGRCTRAVLCGSRHRPFRVGGRHARVPRVCVCVLFLAGSGRPPSWAHLGAPHLSFGRSWCALCSFGPLKAGVAPFVVVVGFFFFSPSPPLLRPYCVLLCAFSRPGCLGPWPLVASPPSPPLRFFCFLPPPHPPVVSGVSCFPAALGLCAPPPFIFFVFFSRFFFFWPVVRCGAGLCVLGRRVCPRVPRWCCPCRCSVCAGWCCVVLAVGPGCPVLSPGGSWCRASVVLSLSGRLARRPVVRRGVSWCSSALCCVLLRCAVVWWCAVVLCRLFASLPVPVVCFLTLRVCCVCSEVSCCVFPVLSALCGAVLRCAGALSLCCARRLCCSWWLVLLVPGVAAFCWGSAGGSGCPALSFGGVCRLWCPCLVWPSLGVFPVVSCSPVLCPVALCCRVVLCCGALSSFFLFFSLPVALVCCCSPLVLGSGPVPGRFCFCALPVRCCAGVPGSLLSVRCSLALPGLAGVLCCCLLCLGVCCWAWLSSIVSWWVLVAPGVVSRWHAVVCPWVLCCAVLLRIVLPGVALLCAVLFRFAPFGAAARCVVSWALSDVLGSCAFWRRVLSCPPALCVFCCGVSLRGVVRRCALCRVRPGVSCCVFPVVPT